MLLFQTDTPPITTPLIQIVIKQAEEEPPKKKIYTLEEKIKKNHYKCDTDIEYIRKDNAKCLKKHISSFSREKSSVGAKNSSTAKSSWYPVGSCTWYVSTRRSVGQWNNATDWKWQAKRDRYTISSKPKPGAIGWTYGHVVYVESVGKGTVTISEANYDYRGSIRTITVPTAKYQYIY